MLLSTSQNGLDFFKAMLQMKFGATGRNTSTKSIHQLILGTKIFGNKLNNGSGNSVVLIFVVYTYISLPCK